MPRTLNSEDYGQQFFDEIGEPARSSAGIVVPMVLNDLSPRSVVDFGCGEGHWLSSFAERGVQEILGYDGPHVDQSRLRIEPAAFHVADLERAKPTDRPFDLAVSLEVAEHLSRAGGEHLLDALCGSSQLVLFSAAVPGQGGTHHINEQWLEYWIDGFKRRGFRFLDAYRPRIAYDHRIAWWYRQNIVLFIASERYDAILDRLPFQPPREEGQEWVHVETIRAIIRPRGLLRAIPRSLVGSVRGRLQRFTSTYFSAREGRKR